MLGFSVLLWVTHRKLGLNCRAMSYGSTRLLGSIRVSWLPEGHREADSQPEREGIVRCYLLVQI